MRSLSKAYGLAGLRLGYGICSSTRIAEALGKIRQAFQVSRLALAAGMAALADEPYSHWIQKQNAEQRERLAAGLEALGLQPLPSVANFVAAAMPGAAGPVIDSLAARGIMIGGVRAANPGYENFIRITVGLPDDIDAVLAALKDLRSTA
jgi:histidinol-phosphate aminotransferase